jgi:hypothetical protein
MNVVMICRHVFEGGKSKVEVMMTENNRVQFAVCFACAELINSGTEPEDGRPLVGPLPLAEAGPRGIPTELPGRDGYWTYEPSAVTEKIQ